MLSPKRTKYRKLQKGRSRGKAYRGSELAFGDYGLQAITSGRISARQIEAARVAITRQVKRHGKMWIRIFPDRPLTKKPLETRMGKGKGGVEVWVAPVKAGRVLYEVEGVPEEIAVEALRIASHKLPVKTRVLRREELV